MTTGADGMSALRWLRWRFLPLCCTWRMAPICWADNLVHGFGLTIGPLCDLHDRLLTREYAGDPS